MKRWSRLRKWPLRIVLGGALVLLAASEAEYYTHETVRGDYLKKVDVDGRAREFLIHIPANYNPRQRLPLFLVFHGSSASASVIERETSFDQRADSLDFIVVYPEGLHRGWNIGECCRFSFKRRVDETAFVSAILDELERGMAIDSTRIYATGYSDGGTLSFLLACNLPHRIAAVAGVSATLFDPSPRCDGMRPVPAMVIHGSADTHVPYAGHAGGRANTGGAHFTRSAPGVTQFWVQRDSCAQPPDSVRTRNVVRIAYKCADGAAVIFYAIVGGEHGWPGGGRGWIFSPKPPTDMVATDSIVRFFLRYKLNSVR